MTTPDEVSLAQLTERLRQERETFDQAKSQDERAFRVRLAFAWVAVVILPAVLVAAILVLTFHSDFNDFVVRFAAAALFVDALSTGASLYRVMITGLPKRELKPVTTAPALPRSTKTQR
jgi:ABC-type transport system involved in cytochrome c biogenesis permease component